MEDLSRTSRDIRHRVSHAAEYAATDKLGTYLKAKNISEPDQIAEEYLRLVRVTPRFLRSRDSGFLKMRENLNSEAGVLISNHPGVVDVPLLLRMLHRNDLLALAGPNIGKRLGAIFGSDKVLTRSHDPRDNVSQFRTIKRHIEGGGLFCLFPTGGDSYPFRFQDGFRVLVEKVLKPDDMVYSAFIDPDEIRQVAADRKVRNIGAISEMLIPDIENPTRREEREVGVDERYSKAGEWQDLLHNKADDAKTDALTEHYLHTFGLSAYPWPEEQKS